MAIDIYVACFIAIFICGVVTRRFDNWYSFGTRPDGTWVDAVQRGITWCILTAIISVVANMV